MIFALLLMARQLHSAEVRCEKKEIKNWYLVGSENSCYITATTIASPGFTISQRDGAIGGLYFAENKEIYFLPEKLAETFPNLLTYFAHSCSITEVSKIHFENLVKLRTLELFRNQIEKIPSNTFEDLKSLEHLDLSMKYCSCIELVHIWLNSIIIKLSLDFYVLAV